MIIRVANLLQNVTKCYAYLFCNSKNRMIFMIFQVVSGLYQVCIRVICLKIKLLPICCKVTKFWCNFQSSGGIRKLAVTVILKKSESNLMSNFDNFQWCFRCIYLTCLDT